MDIKIECFNIPEGTPNPPKPGSAVPKKIPYNDQIKTTEDLSK